MKLYISYFYQIRFFPRNLVPLSTAIWPPKWFVPFHYDKRHVINGLNIPPLQPGKSCEGLCDGSCEPKSPDNCQFLQAYYQQLQQIDFDDFIARLEKLAANIKQGEESTEEIDFAFIVHETPTNPCSERWIIKRWLEEHGIEVEEWHQ